MLQTLLHLLLLLSAAAAAADAMMPLFAAREDADNAFPTTRRQHLQSLSLVAAATAIGQCAAAAKLVLAQPWARMYARA